MNSPRPTRRIHCQDLRSSKGSEGGSGMEYSGYDAWCHDDGDVTTMSNLVVAFIGLFYLTPGTLVPPPWSLNVEPIISVTGAFSPNLSLVMGTFNDRFLRTRPMDKVKHRFAAFLPQIR